MKSDLVLALLLLPMFTVPILYSAMVSLFELGKSKTRIKKLKNGLPLYKKILLLGYVEQTGRYIFLANVLHWAYWLTLGLQVFAIICSLLSLIFPVLLPGLKVALVIRACTLDGPALIFLFVMTNHGRRKGELSKWRWET